MTFRVREPGVVEISYESENDMAPEGQTALREFIEAQLEAGPVVLLFLVRDTLSVELSVPMYWLDITAKHAPKLRAMAITSSSLAVRMATRTFSVANLLRRVPLAIEAFEDERAALEWSREHLHQMQAA